MHELPPAELDWIARAPEVVKVSARLAAPPPAVFAALADAAGWTRWFPLMTSAAYVDSGGGLGREREVSLVGLGRFRERFIAWDEGHRYAFTVVASSATLMKRFAEDYRLTAEDGGTRFEWTMGAEPAGIGKLAAPAFRLLMWSLLTRAAHNLDRALQR